MFLNKLAGAAVIALGLAAATSANAAIGDYNETVDGAGVVSITAPNDLEYVVFSRADGGNPVDWVISPITFGQWVNFSLISADLGVAGVPADSIQVTFSSGSTVLGATEVFSSDTYSLGGSSADAALNAWYNAPATYPQSIWMSAYAPVGADTVKITVLNGDQYNIAMGAAQVVPEPETYAMMLAGLGALGFVARRRKQG